ncbi:lipopolysaccharide biosynthesis protein [Acanthopleuribacter pedis]|uniref:Polysaccharide biosynthesis protein n=1 Tax=Acanthopleuribacter pedis TaxID=442870 RepID=A0A8J7QBM9_9BACT|nr:hypothetical protein [Acanthopleuribacter pedis]MBO1321477.1 hypothetical protein [Acanthopleuribacter pedis]
MSSESQEQHLAADDIPHPDPSEQPEPGGGRQPSLPMNVFASLLANGLYLFSRLFIPPMALVYVSLEMWGIWGFCFVLIGYFGMGAFGISNAYIRFVGVYYAQGNIDRINRLVSTGLAITCSAAVVVLIGLYFSLDWLVLKLKVSEDLHDTAFVLLYGTVAVFMLDLTFGAFQYVLTGLQRIVAERFVYIASFMLEWVLILGLLWFDYGIYALLYAFAARYVFSTIAYVILTYRALPGFKVSPFLVDRTCFDYFIKFGGVVQATGLLAMFVGSVHRLLAGFVMNVEMVGLFDLGEKFPRMATAIPGSVNHALFPAATALEQGGTAEDLSDLYLNSGRYTSLITGVIMGFLACFSFSIISAWVGPDPKFTLAAIMMSMFTLPVQFHTLSGPATSMFKGIGKPWREFYFPVIHLAVLIACIPVGWYLFQESAGNDELQRQNTMNLAILVCVAQTIASFIYMYYANAKFGISQIRYLVHVVWPGLAPYLVGAVLYFATLPIFTPFHGDRWPTLAILIVVGVVYVLLNLGVCWYFFQEGERDRVRGIIGKVVAVVKEKLARG